MKKYLLFWFIFILLVLTGLSFPFVSFAQSYTSRQRIGIGVHSHTPLDYLHWYDFQAFNFGWYFTWKGANDLPNPGNINGVEFIPMFYSGSCPQVSINTINNNPNLYPSGTTFFIGNELGMTEIPNMTTYAQNYHNCYQVLKGLNKNYKVVMAALTSSGRIYQLEAIRAEHLRIYGTYPQTDGYRVNVYYENLSSSAVTMRNFMKNIGDQDKDLIITESCHPDKTQNQNVTYINEALSYVINTRDVNIGKPSDNYMMIQRFGWFLLNSATNGYTTCSLYDVNLHAAPYPPIKIQKTPVGLAFLDWMRRNIPILTPTLTPTRASTITPRPTSTPILPTTSPLPSTTPQPTSTPTPTLIPSNTPTPILPPPTSTVTLIPTSLPSATPTTVIIPSPTTTNVSPTPTSSPDCPQSFNCYRSSTGLLNWYSPGYVTGNFELVPNQQCLDQQLSQPQFQGKTKGDANCDGRINGYDYSLWRREAVDHQQLSQNWLADFSGPNGQPDGLVNQIDFLVWQENFRIFQRNSQN